MLTGSEIRQRFLEFFEKKGHRIVHSSSLVPHNDPTLLFTNAGMNQFKDVFLGLEKRNYSKAVSSQKCVRAGGKHNDLENVGFTNRHHTFFEMLGNFSFGDYYKEEAIAYAWELLTSPQWFNISVDKLYFTIFGGATMPPNNSIGPDSLAHRSWEQVGVPPDRIIAFEGEKGLKENFWQMGDTGPCGPCSEIHYDMGAAASDQGHTDCAFGCDCGRYVEIWNLVFMQFDRDASGKLNPLPTPSIDTGAGLERLTAVLQGVISNYETDLFVPLIKRAAELTGTSLKKELDKEAHAKSAASLRVIADHSRAATFLISDGVLPSNEGRGYVLRKILRRAIRHGRLLQAFAAREAPGRSSTDAPPKGAPLDPSTFTPFSLPSGKPFLFEMVNAVHDLMKDAYPELTGTTDHIRNVVHAEEMRFARTLDAALEKLEELIDNVQEAARQEALDYVSQIVNAAKDSISQQIKTSRVDRVRELVRKLMGASQADEALRRLDERLGSIALAGDAAFKLYDTYGLPLDFIQDTCRDASIGFDQVGFERAMEEQKARARASWKGAAKQTANPAYQQLPKSTFEGYSQTRSENCEVLAIIKNGRGAQELKPGEEGEVILDHTPFYAESGGQVGDRGWFYSNDHNTIIAEVKGCYYPLQGVRAHQVVMKAAFARYKTEQKIKEVEDRLDDRYILRVGDEVDAVVDTSIREATMRNHTATHLLHAGLREVLGKHVKQAGSLVAPNHLRFDFSHFTAVEDEQLQDIEDLINKEVLRNERVEVIENVPIDVAINEYKAIALFGEKYGDRVRVIKIGDFSTELCGGTHTGATGEIGLIKILKEGSVSSGVRRVEALTGEGSLQHFRKDHELENVVSAFVTPNIALSVVEARASPPVLSPAEALKLELEKKDAEIKRLTRELDQARMKQASSSTTNIGEKIKDVRGVKVLAHRVDNLERPQLRTLVDQLRGKIGSGVVVLGSATNGNVALIVGVTKDLTSRIQAGKVIGPVAQKVGGKGGGRPDLAEAGGKDAAALDAALNDAYGVVEGLLSS